MQIVVTVWPEEQQFTVVGDVLGQNRVVARSNVQTFTTFFRADEFRIGVSLKKWKR